MADLDSLVERFQKLMDALDRHGQAKDILEANGVLKDIRQELGEGHPHVREFVQRLEAAKRRSTALAPDNGRPAPDLPAAAPNRPPAPVAGALPGFAQLQEDGLFGAALRALAERFEEQFSDIQPLGSGHFSSGYAATKRDDGKKVVVKLPAKGAWAARFQECAAGLRREAQFLPEVNRLFETGQIVPESASCAAVIRHVAAIELAVDEFPEPVPCLVQEFANGTRVSAEGMLPFRGERESIGVHILAQVTGLMVRLRRHQLAHLDIKRDCLFWNHETRLVEVIDWNTAARNPTAEQTAREWVAVQELARDLFLGEGATLGGAQALQELFVAFRGQALSRGVRLLLLRLHDRAQPNAITALEQLHDAASELAVAWDTPMAALPPLQERQPNELSHALSQAAIEHQRRAANSVFPGEQERLFGEAVAHVQREVRGELGAWIAIQDQIRARLPAIERLTAWLPDIWPLLWLTAFARAWTQHQQRSADAQLKPLIQALIDQKWDDVGQWAGANAGELPAALQPALAALRAICAAYARLDEAEERLSAGKPSEALTIANELRNRLPLERRAQVLYQRAVAGTNEPQRISQLRSEISDLQAQPPTLARQYAIWERMRELAPLQPNHPAYEQQQACLEHLARAEQAYAAAAAAERLKRWGEGKAALDGWAGDAALRQHAPDFARAVEDLHGRLELAAALKPVAALYDQALAAAGAGDWLAARAALTLAGAQTDANWSSQTQAGIAALQALEQAADALAAGQTDTLGEIPDAGPLQPLAKALKAARDRHAALSADTPLASLIDGWRHADRQARQSSMPVAASAWQALAERALDAVERRALREIGPHHRPEQREAAASAINAVLPEAHRPALLEAVRRFERDAFRQTELKPLNEQLAAAQQSDSQLARGMQLLQSAVDGHRASADSLRDELRDGLRACQASLSAIEIAQSSAAADLKALSQAVAAARPQEPAAAPGPRPDHASDARPEGSDVAGTQPSAIRSGAKPAGEPRRPAAPERRAVAAIPREPVAPPPAPEPSAPPRGRRGPAGWTSRQTYGFVAIGAMLIFAALGTAWTIRQGQAAGAVNATAARASTRPAAGGTSAPASRATPAGATPTGSPADAPTAALSSTAALTPTAAIPPLPEELSRLLDAAAQTIGLAPPQALTITSTAELENATGATLLLTGKALTIPLTLERPAGQVRLTPISMTLKTLRGDFVLTETHSLLRFDPAIGEAKVQVRQLRTTVRGVQHALKGPPSEQLFVDGAQGALLWQTAEVATNRVANAVDSVKGGDGYTLLADNDIVDILAAKGDRYLVRVVSNQLDKLNLGGDFSLPPGWAKSLDNNTAAPQGWVLRSIIDGP